MTDTDFSQFNPSAANIETDSTYQGDSTRTGGAVSGPFASQLANKLFYQLTTFTRAFALAMVAKGFSPKDGTSPYTADTSSNAAVTALQAIFANICMTSADIIARLGYTPANINSPTFTGDPKAPTPSASDNDTSIATTAFVKAQNYVIGASGPMRIQFGSSSAGSGTVTFPVAFSGTPVVVATGEGGSVDINTISSTNFSCNVSVSNFTWIAIGPA